MKLNINLYGDIFSHNIVEGEITSTQNKAPQYTHYVINNSGEINLFVDRAIYDIKKIKNKKKNYAWLLESKSIAPDLIDYFKNNIENLNDFELVFTHNLELLNLDDKFKFLHPIGYWVSGNSNLKKTKLISMILSDKQYTKQQKVRNKFARQFESKIDIFGSGFHYLSKKEIGLNNYYFSIVYENDLNDNYFSEKILDCFATKTIPIYSGSRNITKYFDKNGIIFIDEFDYEKLNYDVYNKKLQSVENNYNLVKNFKSPEDSMFINYLKDSL